MNVTRLELDGLVQIALTVHRDTRGFFVERYQEQCFAQVGIKDRFVQETYLCSEFSRRIPGMYGR